MLNVKFVIAVSYERFFLFNIINYLLRDTYFFKKKMKRIHRSNLVLFGVIPLQFKKGESADSLGLSGKERFSIDITDAKPGQEVTVKVEGGKISEFKVNLRIDTESEMIYYKNGGVLNYVIRENLKKNDKH